MPGALANHWTGQSYQGVWGPCVSVRQTGTPELGLAWDAVAGWDQGGTAGSLIHKPPPKLPTPPKTQPSSLQFKSNRAEGPALQYIQRSKAQNMTDTTYNGWRNHATWAIGLHLMDHVVETIAEDIEAWAANDDDNAAQLFRDLVDEQIELADLPNFGLLMDLLDTSDVDWLSLGRHALDAAGLPVLAFA